MNAHTLLRSLVSCKNKRLLFIAPHPDDDAIGCGAFLLHLTKSGADCPASIHIAYAVSGFRGVTDRYAQGHEPDFDQKSQDEQQMIKSEIRKRESIAYCNALASQPKVASQSKIASQPEIAVHPLFWNLPFYNNPPVSSKSCDSQRQVSGRQVSGRQVSDDSPLLYPDIAIVEASIRDVNPDYIFVIDEQSDPHGTHGFVRAIVCTALQHSSFSGGVLGYRVWGPGYPDCQCDIAFFFDGAMMTQKTELISLYESQTVDPAFPHEHHSFIELVKHSNRAMARLCDTELPYAECYKVFK